MTTTVFFTTPELLELGGLPFVSPYEKPTRAEALSYYRSVVDTYNLQIEFGREVIGIAREKIGLNGTEGLAVETQSGSGSREGAPCLRSCVGDGLLRQP